LLKAIGLSCQPDGYLPTAKLLFASVFAFWRSNRRSLVHLSIRLRAHERVRLARS